LARKQDKILLIKVLEDANAVSKEHVDEMNIVSSYIGAVPVIIAEKAGDKLEDNILYTRFNLYTLNFNTFVNSIKNKLYITYYNPETGTSTVFLQYDKKEKKVQLVYDIEEIENEPSPEFQLAAYYALNQPYTKKINLHDEGGTLGFKSWLNGLEKRKYFDKFDPRAGE